ncbi:MAG: hypothetical protein ACW98X_24940 [Promethearchaeota archaeon]|jgi:hypothetical protein
MKQGHKMTMITGIYVFITFSAVLNARACSHFTVSYGNTVFAANNKDTEHKNSHLWCFPPTEGKFGRLLFGVIEGVPGGWIYVQCGINDQGLFIDGADVPLSFLKNDSGKPQFLGEQLRPFILERCSSVNETIELLSQYSYENPWQKQYLVADKYGDAMLVSAGKDGVLKFTRKTGVYLQGTNFNVNDPFTCWRYDRAQQLLNEIVTEENITVEYFREILSSINQSFTVYSNIYDLKNGKVYIYLEKNYTEVLEIDFAVTIANGKFNCSLESLANGKFTFLTSSSTNSDITTNISTSASTTSTISTNADWDIIFPVIFLIILSSLHKKKNR